MTKEKKKKRLHSRELRKGNFHFPSLPSLPLPAAGAAWGMPRKYWVRFVQLSVAHLLRVLPHLQARPTHHTTVSQVQGIPREALR